MLRPGDAAPDFVLKDPDGRDVRLSTLGGPLVLYFYPKDDSPGCKLEARGFREQSKEIDRLGAKIVGVSLDDPATHRRFRDDRDIPFLLLSDPDGRVHDLYEAWRTSLFGRTPWAVRRCTFIIDEDGIIRSVHRNVNVLRHAKQVVQDLQRMKAQRSWGLDHGAHARAKRNRKKENPP